MRVRLHLQQYGMENVAAAAAAVADAVALPCSILQRYIAAAC